MINLSIGLFLLWCSFSVASEFQKCKYGDTVCIKNFINNLLHEKPEGIKELRIGSLDPLHIDEVIIRSGENNPVSLKIRLYNAEMYGFQRVMVDKISGFGKNIEGHYELHFSGPILSIIGDYNVDGQLLILPVTGKGKANLTGVDIDIDVSFTGKEIDKNGKKYLKIENHMYDYNLKRGYMNFENLYNGNTVLGDATNQFINENWKVVFDELKPSIRKSLGKEVKKIFRNVFNNIPYSDLFQE